MPSPHHVRAPGHRAPFCRAAALAAVALALSAASATAQTHGAAAASRVASRHDRENAFANPGFDFTHGDDLPEAKKKTLFRRPSRPTSREQMDLAEAYEKAGKRKKALKAYDALVRGWHHAPETLEAQLGAARMAEALGKRDRAFDEFRYLLVFFGDRLPAEAVLARMIHLADEQRGRGKKDSALRMYTRVAGHAPQWPESRRALLAAARICEEQKEYSEAIRLCNLLLARSPESAEAAAAAHLSGRCGYRVAVKQDRDDSLCVKALSALSFALREFPGEAAAEQTAALLEDLSARRAGIQFQTAAFYDRVRHNPAAAAISYREFARRFPGTPQAVAALARAAELDPGSAPAVPTNPEPPAKP